MDMLSIISFVGFTLMVAVISYYATRSTDEKSSDGYFLGGRSLTAGVIAGSLLLTNLSTEQIVGLNGSSYEKRTFGYGLGNAGSNCNGCYCSLFVT